MAKEQEKQVIQEIVRNAREATGMGQREFADALGVTQYNVYRWENGRTCPSSHVLVRISRLLDCPIVIE
jgi:DNA-binding transcriptional regulator YiaG